LIELKRQHTVFSEAGLDDGQQRQKFKGQAKNKERHQTQPNEPGREVLFCMVD
jgi:hypothetical protein